MGPLHLLNLILDHCATVVIDALIEGVLAMDALIEGEIAMDALI